MDLDEFYSSPELENVLDMLLGKVDTVHVPETKPKNAEEFILFTKINIRVKKLLQGKANPHDKAA